MIAARCIVIGMRAQSAFDDCIVIGTEAFSTEPRQVVIGSVRRPMTDEELLYHRQGLEELQPMMRIFQASKENNHEYFQR